jgi:hypothetical protein
MSAAGLLQRLATRVRSSPATEGPVVRFACNLCGRRNTVAATAIARETPSCEACGSTVRFRAIGHLVAREVLGRDVALSSLWRRQPFRGLGLSDADAYAKVLAARFDYVNTFFHAEPRLDITSVPDAHRGRFRFVIASDVFEHVAPPVSRAFAGARQLLDDDGVLILTVPFKLDGETLEHFPALHDYRIVDEDSRKVLHNVTPQGDTERFENLVFHGGDGATLEMRLFSRDGLVRELNAAGFGRVSFEGDGYPPFGIAWDHPWSIPIVARP